MGGNIMTKQIILHYPGSYVERPHTLVFDDKDEYQEFLAKKSYKLKPNVVYGVFILGATISTEYASNNLKIDVIDKNDWTFNFPEQEPPKVDITVPGETTQPDIPTDSGGTTIPDATQPGGSTNPGGDTTVTDPDKNNTDNEDDVILID